MKIINIYTHSVITYQLFLKYDAVRSGRILLSLQRILLNPSSGQCGEDNQQVKKFPTFMKDYISLHMDKCILMLLDHHFIIATCHSNIFRPLKCHLQGVCSIRSRNKFNKQSPDVKFLMLGYEQYKISITVLKTATNWSMPSAGEKEVHFLPLYPS